MNSKYLQGNLAMQFFGTILIKSRIAMNGKNINTDPPIKFPFRYLLKIWA